MFILDSKLKSDTIFICNLKISQLLLMNDANYLWFILVPQKENLVELTDLDFIEQTEVLEEINLLGKLLKSEFNVDKLNIGALGNMVKQLHIHVIGRFKNDASFPKPVWGAAPALPYDDKKAKNLIEKIRKKCQEIY